VLGYTDEVRPPGAITGSAQPRWPNDAPPAGGSRVESFPSRFGLSVPRVVPQRNEADGPLSLSPPNTVTGTTAPPDNYDFRKPYGASPPPSAPPQRTTGGREGKA